MDPGGVFYIDVIERTRVWNFRNTNITTTTATTNSTTSENSTPTKSITSTEDVDKTSSMTFPTTIKLDSESETEGPASEYESDIQLEIEINREPVSKMAIQIHTTGTEH